MRIAYYKLSRACVCVCVCVCGRVRLFLLLQVPQRFGGEAP